MVSGRTALERTGTTVLACALAAATLVGCSNSSHGLGPLGLGSSTTGGSNNNGGGSNGTGQDQQTTGTTGQNGGGQNGGNNAASCSIPVYEGILNESSSADQQQTSSWTIRHVNTWTVFTPNTQWIIQATSAGGMDAGYNGSDASVGNLYAGPNGGPWTTSDIFSHELSAVSNSKVVCSTSVESDSSGSNQAEEFTGKYQGESIHGILVASVLAPYGYGEIHSLFTPASEWSTSSVTTLSLILKTAIPSPGSLNQ